MTSLPSRSRLRWERLRADIGRERRSWRSSRRGGVCVVGPGKHYLSGVTYYTFGLVRALSVHRPVTVILLRRLVPRRWYPGATRVGADLSHLRLPSSVRRFDGVDWFWGPSMVRALAFLVRRPPAVLLIQWWSAAAWHSQLVLALAARALGARVVIEIHEVIDTGEATTPLAGPWRRFLAPRLLATAELVVVHSAADRDLVGRELGVDPTRTAIVAPPAFDTYDLGARRAPVIEPPVDVTQAGARRLLFFGTIRPYKGLEDLVVAFEELCAAGDADADRWQLTVVGETWEDWTRPLELIDRSPVRDRIELVNRYVRDEEVDHWFARADVVVLPYHRSSTSGPLLVAMAYGLPVVVTSVGGLPEACDGYQGAVLCEPRDPLDLADAIRKAEVKVGERFSAPRSWADLGHDLDDAVRRLGAPR